MNKQPLLIGISACVLGQNVRFDSGNKLSNLMVNELGGYLEFLPICPEVAIGMSIPRPTIRLQSKGEHIRLVETKDSSKDHTEPMMSFSEKKARELKSLKLCGYVVCAKSPTCGMERVKVYYQHHAEKEGVGLYTQQLMAHMPWLPIEENGRLNDPALKENFISRLFALSDLYQSLGDAPKAKDFINFHSRYKLTLMAHHLGSYNALGQLVAKINDYDLDEFFVLYREQFMNALKKQATRKNNTNVLMHMQGYFKKYLSKAQKKELSELIDKYRQGILPLFAPLTLIKHYLQTYPDPYIAQQSFLSPYPEELCLRYGL